jgi:hypothetical protein
MMPALRKTSSALSSLAFLFLFLPAAAYAATFEAHAGVGSMGEPSSDSSVYKQLGIAVVFPQWPRVDLYSGIEYLQSDNAQELCSGCGSIDYSVGIVAVSFGLRFKLLAGERLQVYVALGGIAGEVNYDTDFGGQTGIVPLSATSDSVLFVSPKIGLGVNIHFSKLPDMNIEISVTGSAPAFDMVVLNNNIGQVQDTKLNKGGDMGGFVIGVRHAF